MTAGFTRLRPERCLLGSLPRYRSGASRRHRRAALLPAECVDGSGRWRGGKRAPRVAGLLEFAVARFEMRGFIEQRTAALDPFGRPCDHLFGARGRSTQQGVPMAAVTEQRFA